MTAAESAERAQHYDPREIQEKWQARWDEMKPFRQQRPGRHPPAQVRARHVPVPLGRPAHGPRRGVRHRRRGGPYWLPRAQRAAPDRLGLLRAARRERGDQATRTRPSGLTRTSRPRPRRSAGTRCPSTGPAAAHQRPRVLPLEPVAVPAHLERGLAYRKDGWVNWCPDDQTVLANEQVSAAGPSAAAEVVKREADPVVFQDHRVRRPAAGRHGPAGGPVAGRGSCDAAQLDRPLAGRRRRVRDRGPRRQVTVFTTRPDTLYGATFMVVAADSPLAAEICAPREASRPLRGLPGAGAEADRDRSPGTRARRRPASCWERRDQPGQRRALPIWAADYVLADYGTGAIMAVPAHDQRDLDFARTFGLPVRVVVDTGQPDPAADRDRHATATAADQLGPAGRAEQGQRDRADHRDLERTAGTRRRSTTGCATG